MDAYSKRFSAYPLDPEKNGCSLWILNHTQVKRNCIKFYFKLTTTKFINPVGSLRIS